jgi:hypothetical protein
MRATDQKVGKQRRFSRRFLLEIAVGFTTLISAQTAGAQIRFETLYNFSIYAPHPTGSLVADGQGNLYGTTEGGVRSPCDESSKFLPAILPVDREVKLACSAQS